ncbi:serine/arginine-rich SC35-like splicing factor SCL30A isoform X1 [Raphanus sativus]|uniref:Serine/arginine-rich SC35-like splicing factor SCL30A isoform X1 n=1 Tax=Raphanus sativus TaxID=3726 RepID=A0A9W3CNC2_RAPSA|nr:serine/arginine-rich SC35-like splicing factor SCL30A isoform X1 [Raphanus sativus]XP_056852818.1 serine/arginine-rich SC35-like splicing factor SCL30A isoform X1 [Raphanus sativus]
MRGRSYTPSPPRGYGRRGRSPSPRGGSRYGGGGRDRDLPTSLLVRNLRHDCRQEDLRRPFEQFGPVKDIYLPRDYYTGDPRGFGFIQYVDPADAAEAKHHMEGYLLLGRELTVVFAEENRKKPTEMRTRDRGGRSNRFNDRRRSPPRYSRSPPPRRGGRTRSRSRDFNSPPPKRHQSRSVSPQERRYEKERSYSRSPPRNGSRARSGSREKVKKSYSRSRSPRRSVSPRRNRSYTPEQARSPVPRQSRSPSPRGERNGDRSPSQ